MSEKVKKIGVLMGGLSKEREISLRSGKAVAQALRSKGYNLVEIDVGRDVGQRLVDEKIDVAFVILHGRFGEDGTIQGMLEVMGIPYTGSGVLASAICMNKDLTKKLVVDEGIRTPKWQVFHKSDLEGTCERILPLPVIVKPNREGSTIGMTIVRREEEWGPALREAVKYDETVLVEEFVSGREMTVGVVDGEPLPVLEIVPKSGFYDYEAKYTKGMTNYLVPAEISDGVRDRLMATTKKIWSVLSLSGMARMDYILDQEGNDFFLEVNTIPGMTETSLVPKEAQSQGISFEDLCENILKTASLKVGTAG